jgi:hypothetical protein
MKKDEPDYRAQMLWAVDCAERVLAPFEERPGRRPAHACKPGS